MLNKKSSQTEIFKDGQTPLPQHSLSCRPVSTEERRRLALDRNNVREGTGQLATFLCSFLLLVTTI